MQVLRNVSYGATRDCSTCPSCECMDLYVPPYHPISRLVVFAHGGLWCSGSRIEIDEVCTALATEQAVACATVDYPYSQDLGGCCIEDDPRCNETVTRQAGSLARAFARATALLPAQAHLLGGHSAGGHLALLLSMRWAELAPAQSAPPDGFVGVEGIYNASLWDAYDEAHFKGRFRCPTRQAFGEPAENPDWRANSPTAVAAQAAPVGPCMLLHSPGDDYVQVQEAVALYEVLKPAPGGVPHRIDIAGGCVQGEHEDVLEGASAQSLARCMAQMVLT